VHLREHGMQNEGVGVSDTRPAGWYPDPWGTDGERYFDGSAWARETRRPGGTDGSDAAPTSPPAAAAVPTSPAVTPQAPAPPAAPDTDGSVSPGWHRDPWGLAALRWWDGATWTGHVSGPPDAGGANIAAERNLARWVQPALLVGGFAQAFAILGSVPQAQWLVTHWEEINRPSGPVPQMPVTTATSLAQLSGFLGIAVGVLFLVWFYRAASTAWSSGLPARRGPLMATFSFVIPVLNLWWPYQATLDMVPATDRRPSVIRLWWALWLLGTLCGLLVLPAAAVYTETVARVVAGVGAAVMVAAALAARAVVAYVTDAHSRLVDDANLAV
jgi:hypothetical protein